MTKIRASLGDRDRAVACALAGDTGPKMCAVQGMVFSTDANGGRSVVPGAKVSLNGPTPSESSADVEGKLVNWLLAAAAI
jgi:hypothetical protein